MHALIPLPIILAAILAIAPASADLYKWVDERGVTNYSNEPPADPKTAKKLTRVDGKLSVYTPDAGLLQAVKAFRIRTIQALAAPAPERPAPQYAAAPAMPQSPYEQCLASGRLGCDTLYGSYYPSYLPVAAFFPGRPVPPTRFLVSPPSGTAGAAMAFRSVPRERVSRGLPLH